MHWPDLAAFAAMGGYAPYVWGSVGACALAMVAEVAGLRARRRRVEAQLREAFADDAAAPPDGSDPAWP